VLSKRCPAILALAHLLASAEEGIGAETAASTPRLATKSEYVACLAAKDQLDAATARFEVRKKQFDDRARRFRAAHAGLDAQVKQHPPRTEGEVASYNRAVAAANGEAQALNRESEALQRDVEALNLKVADTNGRCGALLISPELAQEAEAEHRRKAPGR
jgi:hypothetical protein